MNSHLVRLIEFLQINVQLSQNECAQLISCLSEVRLSKDQFLLRSGETPNHIGFVVEGLLRTYMIDASGKEFIKCFAAEGSIVAPYPALIASQPSSIYIQALENSILLVCTFTDFEKLTSASHSLEKLRRTMVDTSLVESEKRAEQLLSLSATERYRFFVQDYPLLNQRLPRHYVASYLGITPEALSRLGKK